MDPHKQPRKVTGSSDRGRRRHSSSVASHPQHPHEQLQHSPYLEDGQLNASNRSASPYPESGYPHAATRQVSDRPQAPSRQQSKQAATHDYDDIPTSEPRTTATSPAPQKKGSASSSEGWDMLEQDQNSATLASSPTPSYDFPGTWPAAIHDTTTAVKQVGSATASYASAVRNSGIGKAGWSVGIALATTANKRALSLVDWAADRTGTGVDNLPKPISGWLKGGRKVKEDRRRAERKRREKEMRRARGEPSPEVSGDEFDSQLFNDEQGSFTLEMSDLDTAGDFESNPSAVGTKKTDADGWSEASTRGGGIDIREYARRSPEAHDENEETDETDGMTRLFHYDDEE